MAVKAERGVHEFGIAWEIWQSVQRAAERSGGGRTRVRSIAVEIGELNLIEDEQLRFWISELAERDGSPGAELRITHLPPAVRCRGCGETRTGEIRGSGAESGGPTLDWSGPRAAGPCPRCGSVEVEVTGGRQIRVVSAEVEAAGAS
jgi:hydrogenase nickel incorporation protein HypA/HybF